MTVCSNRPNETPGFFTGCALALGHAQGCVCGKEVEAEMATEPTMEEA